GAAERDPRRELPCARGCLLRVPLLRAPAGQPRSRWPGDRDQRRLRAVPARHTGTRGAPGQRLRRGRVLQDLVRDLDGQARRRLPPAGPRLRAAGPIAGPVCTRRSTLYQGRTMSIGFRILTDVPRAPDALIDRFLDVPTAHISDRMQRLFAAGAPLRPLHRGGKLLGNALTVKVRPGDNLMVHKAIDMAQRRDVIVVDAGGDLTQAIIGELMMRHAQKRGIAGLVINGAVRDLATIGADTYPVYGA